VETRTGVGILRWVTWRSVKKFDGRLTEVPTWNIHERQVPRVML